MSEDRRSRYSKVYRRMWVDARFVSLSSAPPNGQTLFQRLLTGPELSNIPGLFMSGEAGLAEALGWPLEGFREAFREVSSQGLAKADWKARFVFVPKSIRHNKPESPNVVLSWRTAWDELPECALKCEAYRALRTFVEGMGKAFAEAFAKACPDPSPNQEQEQEQEQKRETICPPSPDAGGLALTGDPPSTRDTRPDDVWEHYVATMKRHRPRRRPTKLRPEDRKTIRKHLDAGLSVADLKLACEGLFRSPHHIGQNDRGTEYLEIEYALRKPATFIALAENFAVPERASGTRPVVADAEEFVDPAVLDAELAKLDARFAS